MSFDGLIDYSNTITDEDIAKSKEKKKTKKSTTNEKPATNSDMKENLADHALVFMFSSLTASFHQPIGVFATRGSTPCEIMAKLIITAIISIEKHGGIVDATVCDGAQNNRGIWKIFGVRAKATHEQLEESEKNGETDDRIVCSFVNPATPEDSGRKIFVISDVPHLFKCVRNNIVNHTEQSLEVELNYNP